MNKPYISVIIPTWRKSKILNLCLQSLYQQSYPHQKFEIILITSNKLDIQHPHLSIININKNINHAEARNLGVDQAKGSILAFCDDDCTLPKNWLTTAASYYTQKKVDLISGPVIPPIHNSLSQRLAGYLTGSRFTIGFAAPRYRNLFPEQEADEFDLILANTFIKKKLFQKFGGFNKNQVPCEENFLYARLKTNGYKLLYVPKIACLHPAKPIILPWAKKIWFYAQGRGALVGRAPETFYFQYIIPSFFTLTFICLILASPFSLLAFSFLLALLLVYSTLNIINATYIYFKFEKNPLIFILAPLTTFIIHVSYGLGFLNGLIFYLLGNKKAVKMPTKI